MTFDELDEEQLLELKQNILSEKMAAKGETPSCTELAAADSLVEDGEARALYGDTVFSPDDFFCSVER